MFGISTCSIGLLLVAFIHTAVTKDHLVMRGVGHKVILPCVPPLVGSCSNIEWFHSTSSRTYIVARIPEIEAAKPGRLNIRSDCALHINNITAVDVGRYWCSKSEADLQYLSLITVSSQPRSNLLPGATVILNCLLETFEGLGSCSTSLYQGMSLKWQQDIQPEYMRAEQSSKCDVTLTVIIQRGNRFSCLALVNHQVQSKVEFSIPIPVGGRRLPIPDSENNDQDGDDGNSQVIIAVAVVGCCAMTVVLALIVVKKKRKPNDQLVAHPENPLYVNTVINTDVAATEEDVTYADIMVAAWGDRKPESEATVYATVHPTSRNNL